MSSIIDKIKELVNQAETPADPAPPAPETPPAPPVNTPEPPADPPQPEAPNIEELLKKQKEELEASFEEKLKNIKSDTRPPAPAAQPPAQPESAGGVDGQAWNKRLNEIKEKLNYN